MLRAKLFAIGISVTLFAAAAPCEGCLWDYDTLEMERRRFPDTLELITGKFLRHSAAFYRWRIEDRQRKIGSETAPGLYDDLAVAYDKLGEHQSAIDAALECERLFPGRYETAANLGTFYIHAGELEKGLEYIDRALAINSEAHFGREVQQKRLVEYLLTRQEAGSITLPLDPRWPEEEYYEHHSRGFSLYLEERFASGLSEEQRRELIREAIQGVLGMMKFGHNDSPILLEALGDLLCSDHRDVDAKRLAARAYLRAAESCGEPTANQIYRTFAARALEIHVAHDSPGMEPIMTLEVLGKRFRAEQRDADRWYSQLEQRERDWIESGADVEGEFREVYYRQTPQVVSPRPPTFKAVLFWRVAPWLLLPCLVMLIGVYVRRWPR